MNESEQAHAVRGKVSIRVGYLWNPVVGNLINFKFGTVHGPQYGQRKNSSSSNGKQEIDPSLRFHRIRNTSIVCDPPPSPLRLWKAKMSTREVQVVEPG